jgi:anti-anti-sigma factor
VDSAYLRVRHARPGPDREVWTLVGEIDVLTMPLLNLALRSANAQHTVVNLTHVEFLDLAGARALVVAAEQARDAGRRFSVVAPTPLVCRVLTVSGLAEQLEIHNALAEVFPAVESGHSGGVLAPTTEEETPWRTHRPSPTRRH